MYNVYYDSHWFAQMVIWSPLSLWAPAALCFRFLRSVPEAVEEAFPPARPWRWKSGNHGWEWHYHWYDVDKNEVFCMVWTILDLCFQEEHQQDKCRIKLQRCCYKMVVCSMKNKVSVSATNISVFTSEVGWTGLDSGRKRAGKDSFQTHIERTKVFGWISSSQTKSRIQWTNMGISSIKRDFFNDHANK